MSVGIARIREAAALLAGHVLRTPLTPAPPLSELTGARVLLKLESLQPTGSFKVRGVLVKLKGLGNAGFGGGVIAVSAGNHAQGVAYHAHRLGIPATVVMPRATPFTKIGRTAALGARVVLEGEDLSQARAHAETLAEHEGLCFIHPYDDADIIAGQGTIGLEMLADAPELDCLIVPIGGGGLCAGIAVAAKKAKPDIEIFGVQTSLYPSMWLAIRGEAAGGGRAQTIAEGIAVKQPGALTRPLIEDLVEEIFLVDEAALERAVYTLLDQQRLVVEGAGAAPLAALTDHAERFVGRTVGLVVSGGNIDSMLLSSVLMRGIAREGRLAGLRVEIPDTPGVLAKVTAIVGNEGANIIEVYHRRLFYDVPVKLAEVDVVVETRGPDHVGALIVALRRAGFPTRLLAGTATADGGQPGGA
jgi:threonine dehydratase